METHEAVSSIHQLRGLVIDMDGVLWQGDKALPGFADFFAILHKRGIKFILATNNNTMPPEGFQKKAAALGAELTLENIMTASLATVAYLKAKYPPDSPIFVVGEPPLKNMIREAGFDLVERDAKAVVAAMDRQFTYDMLKWGSIMIRGGAEFIGVNPDACYPTPDGLAPGSGPIIAALSFASGVKPTIIGKPEKYMFETCLNHMGLMPEETASLGDRLDTDIEGGLRAGMKAILVFSGVTQPADLEKSPIHPTWKFTGIDALAKALD